MTWLGEDPWIAQTAPDIPVPSDFEHYVGSLMAAWRYRVGDAAHDMLSLRPRTARLSGLDELGPTQVWRLACNDRQVTDSALEHVSRHAALEEIFLNHTAVTDVGMHALARLPALRLLTLNNCAITDVGLATIGVIESLEVLELYGTQVTGAGLRSLLRHPNLKVLDVRHTKVHDGLEPLTTIPTLREVRLSWWAERHAAVLRASHPDIVII